MIRLLKLRKKNHIKQHDLALVIGKSDVAYSMYETGKRQMDYATLIKLADYFSVSIDYILGRDTNSDTQPAITPAEQSLLDDYNILPVAEQQYIRGVLVGMARQYKKDSRQVAVG